MLFVHFFRTAETWESITKGGLRLRDAKQCMIKRCASKFVDTRDSNTVWDDIFYQLIRAKDNQVMDLELEDT